MGYNSHSQFGDGMIDARHKPVCIMKVVKAIGTRTCHSPLLTDDGQLYSMGCNDNGQLGDGTTEDVRIMKGVKAITI